MAARFLGVQEVPTSLGPAKILCFESDKSISTYDNNEPVGVTVPLLEASVFSIWYDSQKYYAISPGDNTQYIGDPSVYLTNGDRSIYIRNSGWCQFWLAGLPDDQYAEIYLPALLHFLDGDTYCLYGLEDLYGYDHMGPLPANYSVVNPSIGQLGSIRISNYTISDINFPGPPPQTQPYVTYYFRANPPRPSHPVAFDAEAFKIGFALGRLMWTPESPNDVDSGLGWSADPDYISWFANDYLGVNSVNGGGQWQRWYEYPYYKTNNGAAVGAFVINRTVDSYRYFGPILLSTEAENVSFERREKNSSSVLYYTANAATVNYAGKTWYVNSKGSYDRPTIYSKGDLPLFDATGYASLDDICIAILEAANVHGA